MQITKRYCDRCKKEIDGRCKVVKSWVQNYYTSYETRDEVLKKELCRECYVAYLKWLKVEADRSEDDEDNRS